jgi:hypothetical protein
MPGWPAAASWLMNLGGIHHEVVKGETMDSTHSTARRSRWLPFAIILVSLVLITCAYALLPQDARVALVSESGAVELGTSLFFAVLLGILLVTKSRLGLGLIPAVLTALMLARELDLHRRFTTKGILSIGFYTDPAVPAGVRVVVAVVLAGVAIAVALFLIRIAPQLIAAVRRRSTFVYSLAAAAFLIGMALALDGAPRKLHTLFSVRLPATTVLYLAALEETVELLIPAMLLLAVWQGLPQRIGMGRPKAVKMR